jgi:hypothetical protein
MVAEMAVVLSGRYFGLANLPPHESAGQLQQHQGAGAGAVYRLRLSLRDRLRHPAGGHHRRRHADPAQAQGQQGHAFASDQIAVKAKDRMRLVKMAPEVELPATKEGEQA